MAVSPEAADHLEEEAPAEAGKLFSPVLNSPSNYMNNSKREQIFIQAIKSFNEHNYFEAHDLFEELWLESETSKRKFLQGLIQISAGCFHLICGNIKGAKNLLTKGKIKIVDFSPVFEGVVVNSLVLDIKILIFHIEKNILYTDKLIEFLPEIKLSIKENPQWQ